MQVNIPTTLTVCAIYILLQPQVNMVSSCIIISLAHNLRIDNTLSLWSCRITSRPVHKNNGKDERRKKIYQEYEGIVDTRKGPIVARISSRHYASLGSLNDLLSIPTLICTRTKAHKFAVFDALEDLSSSKACRGTMVTDNTQHADHKD